MSSHEDEPAANDNTPISPPNVDVVSETKLVSMLNDKSLFQLIILKYFSLFQVLLLF